MAQYCLKTAICTVAKFENDYINDWVEYHLNLGFDKIYIYDNNDPDYPFVGDCIENKENVVVIDSHFAEHHFDNQIESYNDFITKYAKQYDWCLFIDVDEFIRLNTGDVKDFLSGAPERHNILLPWRIYGDDDIIIGDKTKPVYERFVTPKHTCFSSIYKSFVDFNANPDFVPLSPHRFDTEHSVESICYGYDFKPIRYVGNSIIASNNDLYRVPCYIAHYQTKSLSEYLEHKFGRIVDEDTGNVINGLNYYFQINDKTPDKLQYIKDQLGVDY